MNTELLKARLAELNKQTKKESRFFTEYDSWKVERHLDNFLSAHNLNNQWSTKRNGYVIECPGILAHGERERTDDCTLNVYKKSNGFLYISGRCRHTSCGDALTDYVYELNKMWGQYLNERYTN